ncbi:hypothetical protein [Pseudopedobacter beijingensis]|uniref:DUF1735 domain-containing protein n=1 Tax=Pseudopedobacter beijingensis TaxID=1207056 RepID=A0ABW4IF42_9SPHI
MRIIFLSFCFAGLILSGSCTKDIDDYPKSNLRAITAFSFEPYHNNLNNIFTKHEGVIDQTNKVITVHLPSDAILTNLKPSIALSPWTTVSPGNLDYVDFTEDRVDFTVKAQSGKTAVYSVVRVLDYKYTKADLYSISFPEVMEGIAPLRRVFPNYNNNVSITITVSNTVPLNAILTDLELSPVARNSTVEISDNGSETNYRPFTFPGVVDYTVIFP